MNNLASKEAVILLHGIFRTRRAMRPLEKFLQKKGYIVLNLDYPSTRLSLNELLHYIHGPINEFLKQEFTSVHFVGYSMGELLIRAYLKRNRPEHMGRVVMLGTPNKGSHLADFLKRWRLYRWLWGPAGQELGTKQEKIIPLFGDVDYELGIIAGSRSWDPLCNLVFDGPHDSRVAVESTKLEGMRDHLVLPLPHFCLPISARVKHQVLSFLQQGSFNRS